MFFIEAKVGTQWIRAVITMSPRFPLGNMFDTAREARAGILTLIRTGWCLTPVRVMRDGGSRAVHVFTAAQVKKLREEFDL